MDDTDRKLLALMRRNARLSVALLARRLGLARTTVQARIERLERRGVIAGYTIVPGPALSPARLRASVLLRIEPRASARVLPRLETLPQVECVHTTSGRFDLIVELAAGSTEELDRTLDRIGAITGVLGSESLIHLSTRIDRRGRD